VLSATLIVERGMICSIYRLCLDFAGYAPFPASGSAGRLFSLGVGAATYVLGHCLIRLAKPLRGFVILSAISLIVIAGISRPGLLPDRIEAVGLADQAPPPSCPAKCRTAGCQSAGAGSPSAYSRFSLMHVLAALATNWPCSSLISHST
jgi:hypothetical protein